MIKVVRCKKEPYDIYIGRPKIIINIITVIHSQTILDLKQL